MRKCQFCQFENREGAILCEKCGAILNPSDSTTLPVHSTVQIPSSAAFEAEFRDFQFTAGTSIAIQIHGYPQPIILDPSKQTYIFGRVQEDNESAVDFDLNPFGAYSSGVSRVHAQLNREEDTLTLTDLGSTNGTTLNGRRLQPQQNYAVHNGDEIRFGKLVVSIRFVSRQSE